MSTQDAETKYTLIFFTTSTNDYELLQAKTQGTVALHFRRVRNLAWEGAIHLFVLFV